jgi:signal transduction histidine kinase/ligand-binding sensor domain-containing protein/DNA-binding response OmpR family regulator
LFSLCIIFAPREIKYFMMKQLRSILLLAFVIASCALAHAILPDAQFRRIAVKDGLSNSQINGIFRDSRGFMWFATAAGLNRYDGFSMKKFFSRNDNAGSLPDDNVLSVQEDRNGMLWVKTARSYAIYNPRTETFDRDAEGWMKKHHMKGWPDIVVLDKQKNMYIVVQNQGCYYYNTYTGKVTEFPMVDGFNNTIPTGTVSSVTLAPQGAIVTYNNGTFTNVDGLHHRVLWVNSHITASGGPTNRVYTVFVDNEGNYWVATYGATYMYMQKSGQWAKDVRQISQLLFIDLPISTLAIRDVKCDKKGRVWIGTDHEGLLVLDYQSRKVKVFTKNENDDHSLSDNTVQCLLCDKDGALWVGTYMNGLNYYAESTYRFRNVELGNVNTIAVDHDGNYWCGTNESGILVYNPKTSKVVKTFTTKNSLLASDVMVCMIAASDGSIWAGTYNGGMVHIAGGKVTVYRAAANRLSNDNVWSILEDRKHNLWIATLGGGLQYLDIKSDTFTTYNNSNSGLSNDYLSSLTFDKNGNLIIGHSGNFSIMDVATGKIQNYTTTRDGKKFSNESTTQILADERGLIWDGTMAGLNVYDPINDQLTIIDTDSGLYGSMVCSVIEDKDHTIWVSTDNGVSGIKSYRNNGKWTFVINSYDERDGLQGHQFNQRSITSTTDGTIIIGGQEGINIFDPMKMHSNKFDAKVLFSGVSLFGHTLSVGEEFNGRVICNEAINESRVLTLHYNENVFTVYLASDNYISTGKSRFKYKLEGFNDDWITTTPTQYGVTFTNLSPGTYTLYAKVVNGDGFESNEVSKLTIIVEPPFWRTIWAYIFYVLLIVSGAYYANRYSVRRQENKYKMEQMRREAEKDHEIDEMKLRFFTNISHELRTPLTLIISPIVAMIKDEDDDNKRQMLLMIHRNALRLLNMVNQLLDFRRIDMNRQQLNLVTGNIVTYIQNITNSFTMLAEKQIDLTFSSSSPNIRMSFDEDKIGKIMNNLLSNAYKFTPANGRVSVSLEVDKTAEETGEDLLVINVADTGVGISDEDKQHVFERFFQANNQSEQAFGGSGVGLNLVKEFTEMHNGEVRVKDNPGGGTIMVVELPIHLNENVAVVASAERSTILSTDALSGLTPQKTLVKTDDSGTGNEYTVLLVDDSQDFLDFMKSMLSEKYKIIEAHDGKEALEVLECEKPDVILSDVMMPVMDGNELCRQVKGNPNTKQIPFVLLTARLAEEQKIEGMENGADDYITKPFNLDLLDLRISNLIKWHQSAETKGKIQPQVKEIKVTSLDEKLIKNATDYVEKNLANSDMSVEDLSSELNMSRVHLYKKMLSLTGYTPSEFIRLIRLRHAEQLLRQSQLSVSEVSYQVGFNNPRYFSKYFNEMYGMMPSVYKEKKGR